MVLNETINESLKDFIVNCANNSFNFNWIINSSIGGAAITFFLYKFIYPSYIIPYRNFKLKLSKTRELIYFHDKNLTQEAKQMKKKEKKKELNKSEMEQKKEIDDLMVNLRKIWAQNNSAYFMLSNSKIIKLFRFPNKKEFLEFQENLMYLSNSTLYYYQDQNPTMIDTPEKRRDIIRKIKDFLDRYN